jgi:hypothetical protein
MLDYKQRNSVGASSHAMEGKNRLSNGSKLQRSTKQLSLPIPMISPGARGVLAVLFLASAKPRGQS